MTTTPDGPAGGRLRVLLVEGHADTAGSLAELFRLEGHQVRVAPDCPAALREAAAEVPDVVLLDLDMPGLDGWELARRLKGQAGGKPPLTIAVGGWGWQHSREAGIDLHLLKPADPEYLCHLLRQLQQALGG
jgi:two-component system, OmpR family, response regulator